MKNDPLIAQDIPASARSAEVTLPTAGFSMYPTILPDDQIIVSTEPDPNFQVGDIIAFSHKGLVVCHRIKEIRLKEGRPFFVTQGDAHKNPDAWHPSLPDIAGKVTHVIRGNRRINPYVQRPSPGARLMFRLKRWSGALAPFGERLDRFAAILQLSSAYRNTAGALIALFSRRALQYYFSCPLEMKKVIVYKYIYLPVEHVLGKETDFFRPLEVFGHFKLAVFCREKCVSTLYLTKLQNESGKDLWAITDFVVRSYLRGTGLENKLVGLCFEILARLNRTELYFVVSRNEAISALYAKEWKAVPVSSSSPSKLYRLPAVAPGATEHQALDRSDQASPGIPAS